MISLGLSAASHQTLLTTLASHHDINIKVQVLDLSHNYLGDISSRLVDGQMDLDFEAENTRSLKLILLDPVHQLHLDSNSPDNGALYMDRMIRIIYNVTNPSGTFSVDIPLFCGPIRKLDRVGVLLNVECHSKEVLLMNNFWKGRSHKKGVRMTSIIYATLFEAGERKMQIPVWNTLSPVNVNITSVHTPWIVVKRYASALSSYIYYDGRGVAVMRGIPQSTAYTFTEEVLKSEPQIGYDTSKLVNAVQILGAIPKGSKKPIFVRVIAPNSHPLSPFKLHRNGYPQYFPEYIQDDNIRTVAQAKAIANWHLSVGLIQSVSVAFDCLPGIGALLEGGDVVRLSTGEFNTYFRLTKMSVPLTVKGSTSIGYNKKLTPKYGPIRRIVRR
jgi:hypothetical protein